MATKEEIVEKLALAVENYKLKDAVAAANEAVEAGVDPVYAINEGLVKGMNIVGEKFAEHKVFLPHVLTASKALYGGLDILLPLIPKAAEGDVKTAVAAVVQGDVHDIGKNILKTLLTAGGYLVTDLGKDVPPETIVEAVKTGNTQVLCMSTLMTPTMEEMANTIGLLKDSGCRGNCTVTIGGPPTSPSFAESIGADHRDKNAQDAVAWIKANA
ncbi:MAG: cobalamin-dependent protein [archaeon]|nr:cobalamin-dependent protein [archaeon]